MYGGVQDENDPLPLKAFNICVLSSPPEGLSVGPHCVLAGGVHGFGVVSPSGKVAGSPALDQSIARLEASMFDHACPYESAGSNSNIEIRGNRYAQSRLIYL